MGMDPLSRELRGMFWRNALRAGGFRNVRQYWSVWLREALSLPVDKIAITDAMKSRIDHYKEWFSVEYPPVVQEIETEHVEQIEKRLEERYGIELPDLQVFCSDKVKNSFFVPAPSFNLDEFQYTKKERNERLAFHGASREEIERIDSARHAVFLARKQPYGYVGLYGSACHELAHVAAHALGARPKSKDDSVLLECFAMANEYQFLLQATKDGLFSEEEATHVIARSLESAKNQQYEPVFFILSRMNLQGTPDYYKTPYYQLAAEMIQKHNPSLLVRNRNLNDLMAEFDRTIEEILEIWRRQRLMSRLRIIVPSFLTVGGFALFLVILFLL